MTPNGMIEALPKAGRTDRPLLRAALSALIAGGALCAMPDVRAQTPPSAAPEAAQADRQDFSQAERLLFMGNAMTRLKPPATLHYAFRKSGSLEEGFSDDVNLRLKAEPDGSCCAVDGEFLSGARQLTLPSIEHAEANPVVLYFLERDVRDMKRLTKGSENYYRKRIRMAVYNAATVTKLSLPYQGRSVSGERVSIAPYEDDPARSRFEKFSRKSYEFYLSDQVPGGVYGIRSVMRDEAGKPAPMIVEELFLDGAEPSTGRDGR